MDGRDVVVGLITVATCVVSLVAFVALGWYAVWRLFLSRFSFIRELLGNQQEGSQATTEDAPRPAPRPRGSRKMRRD